MGNNFSVEKIQKDEISKQIKKLIKLEKYNEAIMLTEEYPTNVLIQSQRMIIAIKQKDYKKVKEIGNRQEFIDSSEIQLQVMIAAIQKEDYEKAKEIGDRPEFINDPKIQVQRMYIAINEKDYEKVDEIGNRQKFINEVPIQEQMMIRAINKEDYETAKQIGDRPKFINHPGIQLKRIIIAMKEEDYEKAKEIGNRQKLINNVLIQEQMIIIAIKEKDYEKAKEIEDRSKSFIDDTPIQSQKSRLATKTIDCKNKNVVEQDIENDVKTRFPSLRTEMGEENRKFLDQIKTKIYYGKIQDTDIDEIKQSSKITEKQKIYILLAIYEIQKNASGARKILKEYKSNNKELADDKNLNIIMQRIENKKKQILNLGFYYSLLNWEIDEELKEKYEQEKSEKYTSKIQLRKEFVQNERVISVMPKENNSLRSNTKNMKKDKTTKKDKALNRSAKQRYINHFEEVVQYLTEKRKEIYVKMQSSHCRVQQKASIEWDKMELLIEKIKKNQNNKEYINKLYDKISRIKEKELLDKGEDENER